MSDGAVIIDSKFDGSEAEKGFESFQQKFEGLSNKLDSTGKNLTKYVTAPILGVGTAIVGTAVKSAEAGDRIDKLSQKIGISRSAFQEWEFILSQSGTDIEKLQVGLKTLTMRMDEASNETGVGAEAFDRLRLSATDLGGNLKSQEEMFNEVVLALQNMPEGAEKSKLAFELFGKAGLELMPLLNSTNEDLEDMRQIYHDLGMEISDSAIDSAVQFTDTMDQIKRTLGSVGVELGAVLMPLLQQFAEWFIQEGIPKIKEFMGKITDLIKWFNDLDPGIQKLILGLVGLAAAIGPVMIVLSKVINIVPKVITGIKSLGTALTFLTTNPIGLVIAAIAALIAIGVLLWQNWDEVKAFAEKIWNGIKDFFNKTIDWIADFFKKSWESIKETVSKVMESIKETITKVWNSIKEFFSKIVDSIMGFLEKNFKELADFIKKYMNMAKEIIGTVWDSIKKTFENALKFVKSLVTLDFQGMKDAIKNQMDNIKDTIKKIWDSVVEFFKSINLFDIGKNIIQGLINGIKNMANAVWDTAKDVAKGIGDSIKGFFGISSPSKLMIEYGEDIGDGLEIGMDKSMRDIASTTDRLSSTIASIGNISGRGGMNNYSASTISNNFNPEINFLGSPQVSYSEARIQQERLMRKLAIEWGMT